MFLPKEMPYEKSGALGCGCFISSNKALKVEIIVMVLYSQNTFNY